MGDSDSQGSTIMITRFSIDERMTAGPAAAVGDDGMAAEQFWRDGDVAEAMAAADRVLAHGTDPGARAAGVAAAAAAADGALGDAAERWRGVAAALDDVPGVWATGRAALAAALAGDASAAARDLEQARRQAPDPAPRGLAVLLDGADALVEALRGNVDGAARRLAGLAATTVPADPLASDRWDELAITVVAAAGDDHTAQVILGGRAGRPTSRHQLLGAWLRLRTGHLNDARDALAEAARTPVLRRNAVLGAAVTVGLARRSGNDHALASTWQRVAPVVAGADVELFLLDAWGELSVGAHRVSPADCATIVEAMRAAVRRAGSPWWAVAAEHRWQLERAIVAEDATAAAAAAERLTALAGQHPAVEVAAEAALTWAAVLADEVDTRAVAATITRLAGAGRRWEAAALCRAAVAGTDDPAAARELLGTGRTLRSAPTPGLGGGDLSEREREVGALVIDGLTHKEIGARLYISPKTVEQHVARLRQKLAASNRAALVAGLRVRLEA
jgi:DNA-binding CsgD family transcriptional regulator